MKKLFSLVLLCAAVCGAASAQQPAPADSLSGEAAVAPLAAGTLSDEAAAPAAAESAAEFAAEPVGEDGAAVEPAAAEVQELPVAEEKAEPAKPLRPKYFNFNYTSETLTDWEGGRIHSKYGAAITSGRSFYLHRKPVAKVLRFGIDATWFDLNYVNYGEEIHKGEISMHVGPSITVSPLRRLNIHLYFRYAPTFAMLYDGSAFGYNYASYFVSGGMLSYGVIGVGVEARWGSCKYNGFSFDAAEGEAEPASFGKIKASGIRAYVSFRF